MYLEKFIERPRHIEFQVLGDKHGHVMHLGERECSIQRRHQKLIEESPSPALMPSFARAGRARGKALEQIGYTSAGTVEFLMDEDGSIYFIEMNARIQVEHPVTEMVTGRGPDQIADPIGDGESLTTSSANWCCDGHAIECRINAEDPETFVPSAGTSRFFKRRAARESGWIRRRMPMPSFLRTTIHWLPSSLSLATRGPKPSCGCGAPWKCLWSKASKRPFPCSAKS